MKICILTQPLHTNYGGLLQAYALQKILRDMGHKVLTENRRECHYSLLRRIVRSDFVRETLLWKFRYLTSDELTTIRRYTDQFIEQNINTIATIECDFDAYIVGSDQVWRKEYNEQIEHNFLDFAPSKARKIAYAASFGLSEWEYNKSQTERLSSLAKCFDMISVREADAVELCREHLGVEANLALDPTLLLSREDYIALLEQDMGCKLSEGGVVSYMLDPSPEKWEAVQDIAESLNLTINDISHSVKDNTFNGLGASERIVPPVANWIGGFHRGECVVTDSFHGMVFALIFNKPFVVFANSERGASRFTSLLGQLGLNERLVNDPETFDQTILLQPIDYVAVNARLAELRLSSLDLLSTALR